MNILEDIKESFKKGSSLTRLIYINFGVFLTVNLISVFFFFLRSQNGDLLISWFSVPASLGELLLKPWTVITYMFLHKDFLHILFNMLWLFWFGKIFLEYLDQKKLVGIYLLGGLSGAILYIATFNIFPVFKPVLEQSVALGASASILAIVVAISSYVPNHTIYLIFIGPVKLRWIALVTIVLDIISIPVSNSGGHIAHIGGALFGYLYIVQYRRGTDIAKGLNRLLDYIFSLFKKRKKIKITYSNPANDLEYNKNKIYRQEEIDKILDKISKSGYDSLNKSEKETLFKNSNKN